MIAPLRRNLIVFAGGGTGGHVYPALAVARAMPSVEPLFLVPADRGDAERIGSEFRCLPFENPRFDRGRVLYPARLARAVWRARRILQAENARAVVGLGSYASVPACLAAKSLGLPVYLMAFDAVPGRATRFLAPLARGIGLGSELARDRLPARSPCRVTGTPLREDLHRDPDPEAFGLRSGVPTLLVFGGSQGARDLNRLVLAGVGACSDLSFQIIHVTGPADADATRAAYARMDRRASVHGFLEDMGAAYALADLVICRGGASSVAECLALGKPAIFVPYPWHKDGHQSRNAQSAVRSGAARIVEQDDLDPERLRGLVERLLSRRSEREWMADRASAMGRPTAARSMAAHLIESVGDALAARQWPQGTVKQDILEIGG
ncbi:MAG: UDP-N-acetylglucosamine--N-acetylmuramyl-(pentapeptide) pyrophosphoryl-undecaprenol N-acetylglucosamine transferase [Planctomycetota bacterium]|jgi:UDP-N-acetylglucosamine--N-acetylmuramyl-(pentapeptide) pyrophosphoryl-undecaprenol N-acetylglucosamine transferase